jgi:hypothetical protein
MAIIYILYSILLLVIPVCRRDRVLVRIGSPSLLVRFLFRSPAHFPKGRSEERPNEIRACIKAYRA